ncbi:MAG: hypothetical protein MJ196_07615 [Treponemataceae bacterium]|nr:hypothetical protein [Treponemataceae bacterium]
MTASDFIKAVMDYYGTFENEAVFRVFCKYVQEKVYRHDLDRIYEYFLANIAASWKIDVKTLMDACRALQIQPKKAVRKCTCCGAVYTDLYCPVCEFDPYGGESVESYREFWKSRQSDPEKYEREIERIKQETLRKLRENPFQKAERLKVQQKGSRYVGHE